MSRREIAERHDRIVQELNEERVAALTRISRTLQALVDELQALGASLAAADPVERARQMPRYRELRARALQYRWYLEVQREALGLRHHRLLDEFYAIPPPDGLTGKIPDR
ncbi:MAG TPA: hypothetical protein VNI78_01435 [Vicinamibacterales bacterium]|nr:hypothetical protein [Vicinamibacterales bacterium]